MNLIGHNYIAMKVLNKHNSDIAVGCHIPDMVPFLSDSCFSFEEIHENPEIVLNYLKKNKKSKDLSLGMMTHSVKFGADKFNKDIDVWLLGDDVKTKNDIANMISECSKVSFDTALGPRMHNYLWCGLDFYIIDKYPVFLNQIANSYKNANLDVVTKILSNSYQKPEIEVYANLSNHIGLVINNQVLSKKGFLIFWKKFISELDTQDDLDIDLAYGVVEFIEKKFQGQWESIISRVTNDITERMKIYIG